MSLDQDPIGVGESAALSLRHRSTGIRLALMGLIALLLGGLGHWPLAGPWWLAYALMQIALLRVDRRVPRWGHGPLYVATFASFAIAGAPTWHLWTEVGLLGAVAATMFLCGMMAQLVASSLAARTLFIISMTPLVAYLVAVPLLALGPHHRGEAGTILACALCLIAYLAILWRGQQTILEGVERSRAEALAANRAKTEFLATMSHEIRTPMNAVLGSADLLARSHLSPEQREQVLMLQDAGNVLMQVLNDVLDLSRIEAGKLAIEPATIDLPDLIMRCANFWRPRIADAGLSLMVVVAPDTPRFVVIDAVRTGQILFNLIGNAAKFTASGSITLSVECARLEDSAVEICLSVADTGIGISPEGLGRLFKPFEQADGSITRRFGGTGLGLAISQRLAGMMGGAVSARSIEGVGSEFTLRLPSRIAEGGAESPAQAADIPNSAAGRDLRVLVAEDNPANQRIIGFFLAPSGAAVTFVDNGEQAVDALQLSAFDVVLMDLQMPVMDGLEATRLIRRSEGPNAGVPIFALTANVMSEHQDACRAAGMSGHIAKPIDARILLSTVINAGVQRRAQTRAERAA